MKAEELRQFSVDELRGRVRQWQEELFRNKFKAQTSETRDTSLIPKLRKDIARGNTILGEKLRSGQTEGTTTAAKLEAAPVKGLEDKPTAAAKPAKKATTKGKATTKKAKE